MEAFFLYFYRVNLLAIFAHFVSPIISANVNIRNGVGILPDGNVLFAMSKTEVNFYDFARFFKDKGCTNALYLDGFVSRAYAPSENWQQIDGNFGVMIGVSKK